MTTGKDYPQQVNGTRAYVLVDTEAAKTADVVEMLRDRSDIYMADIVNGPYRVIAVVQGRNNSEVAKTILLNIRKLDGVKDLIVYTAITEEEAKV